jgi:hypothetical protein
MLKVCGHADRDAGWDHPLLESERLFWRNTRTAMHGAVAEAITQSQSAVFNHGSATRDTTKEYRRASLINACKYSTFSSWAQVGFFSG